MDILYTGRDSKTVLAMIPLPGGDMDSHFQPFSLPPIFSVKVSKQEILDLLVNKGPPRYLSSSLTFLTLRISMMFFPELLDMCGVKKIPD